MVSHGVTACHACRGGVTACHGVSRCHHGVTRCHGRVAWCHGGVTRCHAGVTAVSTWCHGRVTLCHAGVASMSRGVTAVSPGVTRCPEVSTLDQHVDMLTCTGDANGESRSVATCDGYTSSTEQGSLNAARGGLAAARPPRRAGLRSCRGSSPPSSSPSPASSESDLPAYSRPSERSAPSFAHPPRRTESRRPVLPP